MRMKTLAERALDRGKIQRPGAFIPNGCGPAVTGPMDLIPDKLIGVEFGDACCNVHDLAYYQGGFWGLFYRKPRADLGLGACMAGRMLRQARENWEGDWKRKALAGAQGAAAIPAGAVYTLAVLAFGWTPLTWRWRKRSPPRRVRLKRIARAAARR